jgi:hypothetical protein
MRFSAAANHSSLKERTLEPRGAEMRSGTVLAGVGKEIESVGSFGAYLCIAT